MSNLDSILKSRDITLPTKVRLVKAMVFPVVMYGCKSWTIKKAECQRIDVFELQCWRRLLRVPWTARRSNQSILREICPEYSLKGLMLKLKLQYFGCLMGRTDSLDKPLMLGKIEGGRRMGWQRMRWLDGATDSVSSVAQSCPTLCYPMDWSTPGFPVLHHLLEFAQTHVHWVNGPSQPLLPPALNLSQHQGLFQWSSSLHQVTKVLELQFQSFQWIFRTDFFRIDWFNLLAFQGTLKSFLQPHSSKASILRRSAFFIVQLSHPAWLLEKP